MTVLTWQIVNQAAILLPEDLRVGNPARLDMSHIVYEAPQNAHRNGIVRDVRTADGVHRKMGLLSELRAK